jgi:hypothetical protein
MITRGGTRLSHLDASYDVSMAPPIPGKARFAAAGATAFWAIAIVPVIVVMTTPHVVVQDGGLHFANTVALRGLFEHWFPNYLTARPTLQPNITVEGALTLLTMVTSADNALKIVLILGLLGYAVAVATLARFAGLPLILGIPLLAFEMHSLVIFGFLGFVWAVPMVLVALAVVLRRPTAPPPLLLTAALTVTWLTHIVPALVGVVAVPLIVVVAHLSDGERPVAAIAATVKRTAIPIAVVAALTLVWSAEAGDEHLMRAPHLLRAMKRLVDFSSPIATYAHAEMWLARALAAAVFCVAAGVVVTRVRGRAYINRFDGLLWSSAVMAVLTVILPEQIGSGASYIGVRISLFATLLFVLWVCTQFPTLDGLPSRAGWAMVAVAAVVAVAIPLVRIPALHRLSSEIDQIAALAPCVPQHSVIVQLNLDLAAAGLLDRTVPMAEQTGAITVSRQSLDLGNESGWYPYYIWRFTDIARADRYLRAHGYFAAVPPPIDLDAAMGGGLPLTAVVVYGRAEASAEILSEPNATSMDRALAQYFTLVRISDRGNAELWLRKGVRPTC